MKRELLDSDKKRLLDSSNVDNEKTKLALLVEGAGVGVMVGSTAVSVG